MTLFVTKLKAGAVVLLVSCTIASLTTLSSAQPPDPAVEAGGDGGVRSKDRIFTPDRTLMYLNIYSTDPGHNQDFLHNYAFVNVVPEIKRVRGVGTATILGNGGYVLRIRLNPERMRAHNISTEDIKNAFLGCSMLGSPKRPATKTGQSTEYEFTQIVRYHNKPEQYENIILKANAEGEILRLKDVGQVELDSSLLDMSLDKDGHPAAAIVLKRAPGSDAAEVIEDVKEKLKQIKEASFPPGMEFEVIPFDSRDMIYAVIETPRGSTLEFTSSKCHELGAIAKGVDGIATVSSLAGYQIRTEGRDSNVGTCLIHLKDRSDRKLTTRQIIETLEGKCRTMNVQLEFFEPPAVSAFVAAGGFSVRVLDKTNSNNDGRPGRVPETFMDDLLNRKDLASLFDFLASNYPQYDLVIDNDVAMQKGVSIAKAMENLALVVGGDVQAERKFRSLVADLSHSFVKNDRGEMVPYRLFMQLKNKLGSNEIDR